MLAKADATPDFAILASFENRRTAERMLASLRRPFRKKARKGHVTALVITGNEDGSLKVIPSRVLTASGFVSTLIRISLSLAVGFAAIFSTFRGGKNAIHEVRERQSRTGSDEQLVHALLAKVGRDAALVLVRCDDQETRQAVVERVAEGADQSWDGSRAELLARLDPGSHDDWARAALDEPS